jgi:hypothetical protein
MKFRKKPVVIEAVQFNQPADHPAVKPAYFDQDGKIRWVQGDDPGVNVFACRQGFYIPTLEGGHEVTPGDWIIKGVQNELYPCKPDIFEATYEPVEPTK